MLSTSFITCCIYCYESGILMFRFLGALIWYFFGKFLEKYQ